MTDQVPGTGGTAGDPPLAEASDIAAVTARFGVQLHDAGIPVDPAHVAVRARRDAHASPVAAGGCSCWGFATLVSGPEQIEIYDRVFAAAFGISLERAVPVSGAVPAGEPGPRGGRHAAPPGAGRHPAGPANAPLDARPGEPGNQPDPQEAGEDMPWRTLASDAERLACRDFADLSAAELLQLEAMMRERALATPPRRTRRYRPGPWAAARTCG